MRAGNFDSRRWAGLLLLLAAGGLFACGRHDASVQKAKKLAAAPTDQVWVRHIFIQYAGAYGAPQEIKRSRSSADSLAHALLARARAGEDFSTLAKQFSDDPSAAEGGEIAPLVPNDPHSPVPPEFLEAALALQPGTISDVVESRFGFHVIQRRDMRRMTAQHILIRYAGAVNCPDSIVRTRSEALALAERILAQVRHPDASFPVAARDLSEDKQTAALGGYLSFGVGTTDPAFEKAAFALKDDEISDIVETPYGFHIIRRIPDQMIRVSHILVTYSGTGELVEAKRTREQALQRAMDAAYRAHHGEDFTALVREFSDDTSSAKKGGVLAPIRAGQTVPEFEDAAFRLKPGEVSDVVETQFGFHVIKRLQ
jgi:peptidyl-prolyl cis-trans isomerase NIMA-interacting 1